MYLVTDLDAVTWLWSLWENSPGYFTLIMCVLFYMYVYFIKTLKKKKNPCSCPEWRMGMVNQKVKPDLYA